MDHFIRKKKSTAMTSCTLIPTQKCGTDLLHMVTFQLVEEAIQLVSMLSYASAATDVADSVLCCRWFGITYSSRARLKLSQSTRLRGAIKSLLVGQILFQTFFYVNCCIVVSTLSFQVYINKAHKFILRLAQKYLKLALAFFI